MKIVHIFRYYFDKQYRIAFENRKRFMRIMAVNKTITGRG